MKDPRVTFADNDEFIDMVEHYFDDAGKKHYAGEELKDERREYQY